MPIEPSIRARLDAAAALGNAPTEQLSPAEVRARLAELVLLQAAGPGDDLAVSENLIPGQHQGIPVRLYTPAGAENAPLVVYFHGGGWISGTLDSHDAFCRRLALESQAVIASVAYRLAPEHPFPAAPEDCLAAVDWAFTQAAAWQSDPDRILVAGDSAGGNLAAVVSLMRRDRGHGPHLAGQILLWPVTGYYHPPTPSYQEFRDDYGLTAAGMAYMWDLYLADRSAAEFAYAAPLRSQDVSLLPPALVITAEYDILRDEGNEYAQRLRTAGVPVQHHCVAGVNHGFAVWPDADPDLAQARAARQIIARFIRP